MSDIQRFELPSGGWWELELDPTHGQVEDIREQAIRSLSLSDRNNGEGGLSDIDVKAMIDSGRINMMVLTTAWGFTDPVPITVEGLRARSARDTSHIQDVLQEHIVPLLEDPITRQRRKRSDSLLPSGSDGSLESSLTLT